MLRWWVCVQPRAGALEMNYIEAMGSYNPLPPSRLQRLDRGEPGLDPEILPSGIRLHSARSHKNSVGTRSIVGGFAGDLSAGWDQLCGLSGDDSAGSQADESDA